ncbi:MAG: nicotinamide-nucleotide amidohydrolase family protein, partial [Planctomycetes bacterium]|nr:nicotinamide-nucleotide amidohydrolase family protein [Planctomycetota bacterium]
NITSIVHECRKFLGIADILIITGGLGPTTDDLTREAIAKAFDIEFTISQTHLQDFTKRLETNQIAQPVNNEVQFQYPKSKGIAIENHVGVALGFMITKFAGKLIVVLPGVPREMMPMFKASVEPEILRRFDIKERIYTCVLKCFGAYESVIDEKIKHLCAPEKDPKGGIQTHDSVVTVRFWTNDTDENRAKIRLNAVVDESKKILGPLVFGFGNDELNTVVAELLAESGLRIGCAESCTAGLLTHYLSQIPGISSYLKQSVISYSNEAKHERLGVSEVLFEQHGAVSAEAAFAMAQGLINTSTNIDLAISITGIAGPGGATEEKPVGLVYIAIASRHTRELRIVRKYNRRGERNMIQQHAALCALNLLRLFLIDRLDAPELGTTADFLL